MVQRVKRLAAMWEDWGSIPGLGISPGEGNSNSLECSCLDNPMDRGAWWATVHAVTKSQTRLRDFTIIHYILGRASLVAQLVNNLPAVWEIWV